MQEKALRSRTKGLFNIAIEENKFLLITRKYVTRNKKVTGRIQRRS